MPMKKRGKKRMTSRMGKRKKMGKRRPMKKRR